MPPSLYWNTDGNFSYDYSGNAQLNCPFELKPEKKPDEMSQELWDARNRVKIGLNRYFRWLNGIWEVQIKMSGYYRLKTASDEPKDCPMKPDCGDCNGCSCCNRAMKTAHVSTELLFIQQTNGSFDTNSTGYIERINKCPKSDETTPVPTYEEVPCPNFNTTPTIYGKRPNADLEKLRYNVCLGNGARGWFQTRYKRTDDLAVSVSCDQQPPVPADINPGSSNADSRFYSVTTCGTTDCSGPNNTTYKAPIRCYFSNYSVKFYTYAQISFGTSWYDPIEKQVYPNILLSGAYPSSGWEGDHPKDKPNRGSYKKHSTKTKITVDDVEIPAGTTWNTTGYEGRLDLDINWTLKERKL
ncbi:MAG: hypothetical protein EBU96_10290 [Actinobacteria bacterium]|nr:hypothetical protein [Actinomycetota bacterium]